MARVALVEPDSASDEQRAAFEVVAAQRGRIGSLWRAMAHSPEAMRRVGQVGAFLRYDSHLPDRLREAVILAISGRWQCVYERGAHEPIAARLGLSEQALLALRGGEVPDELSELEAAAVRYAQALAREGRASGELLAAVQAAGGDQLVVELHLLAGYYTLLALFLNGLEVEPEAPERLPV
jgi:4-carboxymuconolactone decarboxylase